MPSTEICSTAMAVCAGTTAKGWLATPSVASGIDYLTIWWARIAGGNAWNILSINLPILNWINLSS